MGRYRSDSDLPFPAGWQRKAFGAYRYTLFPFFAGLVLLPWVLGGLWMFVTESDARWSLLLGLVLLGPLCYIFLGWGWSELPRTAPVAAELRDIEDVAALVIPLPRPSRYGSQVTVAIGVVLLGVGLCYFLSSLGDDWSMGLGFLFLISLPALFCILIGLGTYRRRAKVGDVGIVVTPERISIDYSEGPTIVEWANLSAVEGRCVRDESKVGSRTNVIRLVTGELGSHRVTDIRHKDLESDPTRLFYLFAFYLHNPDLRAELASERGLRRFRDAAYLPEHSTSSYA